MQEVQRFKYCPACAAENKPTESFCVSCDFDLYAVPVELQRAAVTTDSEVLGAVPPEPNAAGNLPSPDAFFCRLVLLENPAIAFNVAPNQSVGRGAEADIILHGVPHLNYISRRHAQFLVRGEQWFVQYVASGNFIKVDGETIEDDTQVALQEGAVLTLSLTSFRVVLP